MLKQRNVNILLSDNEVDYLYVQQIKFVYKLVLL
jgi:hypothetical protein